ncbi:MAG: helicase-associated domain-containing protein [Myxococcales bacterium]|nr:helicase-associated domain-containing protein [Myxococcales bacterium]
MAKRGSARSTDAWRAAFPNAVAFDVLADGLVPVFAPALGVKATAKAVRAALADEAATARRLMEVPAPALAVLERLVDAGGGLLHEQLVTLCPRLGLRPQDLEEIIHVLLHACLACLVMASYGHRETQKRFVLLDLGARVIASRVRGLTVPPPAPATLPSPAPTGAQRDIVALLASTVHVPIKVTQYGDANRTSVKKLAGVVGWTPERVGAILDDAIRARVLGQTGKRLLPIRSRLDAVAAGEDITGSPLDRQIHAWVGDGWIARDTLVRALVSMDVTAPPPLYGHVHASRAGGELAFVRAEALVDAAGLVAAEHDGHVYLRASPRVVRGGGGDGHVTPSFEVMLGPGADPSLVATVALATEPGRMDVVLTRKITPASVGAACAAGLAGDPILAALDRVGRHPVPDNVRFLVEEWASSAPVVTANRVWALEASNPSAADEVARALGAQVVGRPTPTLVLVQGELADPTPLLAKANVRIADEPLPLFPPRSAPEPERSNVVLSVPGPESLRAHFEREYERDLRDLATDSDDGGALPFGPVEMIDALLADIGSKDASLRRLLVTARRLWRGAADEYEAWASELEPEASDEAFAVATFSPLEIVPWLVLHPGLRSSACAQAKSLEGLLAESGKLTSSRRSLSRDGDVLVKLLTKGEMAARIRELAPPSEGPSPVGSAPSVHHLAPQPPGEVRATFAMAATSGAMVWLRISSKTGGDRVVRLQPERILERGDDVALLGVDPETEQNRSFPLANVLAVRLA